MSLLGDYVKQLRESRGISLSDAAPLIGITKQRLWDLENGRRYRNRIPQRVIEGIARTYRVPVGVIVEETKSKVQRTIILSEYLAETKPIVTEAVGLTAELVTEARAYTPELEQGAIRLFELLSELKIRLDEAYASLYPSTQKAQAKQHD
jgi:transcriptional regulator with XRE-family HTH domain